MDKKYTDSGKLRLFPTIEEAMKSSIEQAKFKLVRAIIGYDRDDFGDEYATYSDTADFDAAILEYQTTKDLFFEVTIVAGKS